MEFKNIKQIKKKLQLWRHTTGLIMYKKQWRLHFTKGWEIEKGSRVCGGGSEVAIL